MRCVRRFGRYGVCDARLEITTDGNGRTISFCPACDRFERGICADCPAPVAGTPRKARRCAACKVRALLDSRHRHYAEHSDRILERARVRNLTDGEKRQAKLDYKRAWRKKNRDKVAAQKRRFIERHRDNPNSRYQQYHARYRKKHGAYYRELQNQKDAEARQLRGVPACACGRATGWQLGWKGRPFAKCMKCLFPCERKLRRKALRARAKAIASDPQFGLPPKPVKIRKPRLVAERGPGRERLCLTPGCEIVVTHRKKKCTACRRRDADAAGAALATRQGKGRRTDMERVA